MPRYFVVSVVACLSASALSLSSAEAASKKVQIPNRYDGAWSITAITQEGPCASSTNYQVQIENGDASIPGDDVGIDGGVSAGGRVQATITKGANNVPITGNLDRRGSGKGNWRTSGGLVECSGTWSARRGG